MDLLTKQEFQFLQSLFNDMYQDAQLRTGPMGEMVTTVRNKFLILDLNEIIELTDPERRFVLFSVNDVFVSSHSPIVQPQLGNAVRVLGSDKVQVVSEISETNQPQGVQLSSSYATTWDLMQGIMRKLGLVDPPPYVPSLKDGPNGEPLGVNPGLPNVNPDDRNTSFGF